MVMKYASDCKDIDSLFKNTQWLGHSWESAIKYLQHLILSPVMPRKNDSKYNMPTATSHWQYLVIPSVSNLLKLVKLSSPLPISHSMARLAIGHSPEFQLLWNFFYTAEPVSGIVLSIYLWLLIVQKDDEFQIFLGSFCGYHPAIIYCVTFFESDLLSVKAGPHVGLYIVVCYSSSS